MSLEDMINEYFIVLMSCEVIPGVRPMTLNEVYKCDILYYIKLINHCMRKGNIKKDNEAFVDLIGI